MSARSTVPEAYARTLGVSAQHKVRALSLLAEGGEEATRTAVTLLHEAWRAERRALRVLEAPSPETRLRAAVEACGCLVDARDPSLVLDLAWGEVLDASTAVSPAAAASIRRRLDPKVNALIREYSDAADRAPELFLRLAQLIARERLAGRKPTIDLLFRVGLGAAVPYIPPSEREDVVRAFRSLDRRAWWGDAAA